MIKILIFKINHKNQELNSLLANFIKINFTIFYVKNHIHGVGVAAIMAMLCAAAIQLPAAIPAPCIAAKVPPATGPMALIPTKERMKGDPTVTPTTIIGVATKAV